ncbi:MAG: histidine phosphatase family protein [Spirochaetales bacterium]|nr:histidine phosphatase family protein [Spirochaetales bacterium]
MKRLYFIRHAESEANKNRILASRMPFSLTREGKADSLEIAAELKEITDIDHIISSPLKRAVETAESFSEVFGINFLTDDRIIEQYLGFYSGMSYDEVKLNPDYQQDPLKRWNWEPSGGGESYSMIAGRICSFLSDVENTPGLDRVLIVTHAVALRLIVAALENSLPVYPKAFPNNGEILTVNFSGLGRRHEIESMFLGNSRKFNHNP